MKSLEQALNSEKKLRPDNYMQVFNELNVKKPLLMKLTHLLITALANENENTKKIPEQFKEQFKDWTQDDFKALLKDLSYSDLETKE